MHYPPKKIKKSRAIVNRGVERHRILSASTVKRLLIEQGRFLKRE